MTTGVAIAVAGDPGALADLHALGRAANGECELLATGVSPTRRRRGPGRTRLARVLARASVDGGGGVFLGVAEDNRAAGRSTMRPARAWSAAARAPFGGAVGRR